MWARSFWDGPGDETERRERAMAEMTLGLAVHDEIRIETLVEMQPQGVLEWVRRLIAQHDGAQPGSGLDQQYAAYEEFLRVEGKPMVADEAIDLGFDEFRRLASTANGAWNSVTTGDSGEYVIEEEVEAGSGRDRPDIYAARHGRVWAILSRLWWQGVAAHVVVLTTEALPTAVASHSDRSWSILHLEAPDLPRGTVEVHAVRGVTSPNLAHLCGEFRLRLGQPDAWVVSNRVPNLPSSMTHARARGSNELIGKTVVQTMAFMSPPEYERLQALNAWMRRSDACLLRHLDEFNQTAGRNLGFRGLEGVEHHLLVNPRLLALIIEGALGRSRYDLRLHMDKGQRHRLKAG